MSTIVPLRTPEDYFAHDGGCRVDPAFAPVRTVTLPLPTLADVGAYYAALAETDPEDRAIITPYGDPAHARQRAAREREVRRGQLLFACAILVCLAGAAFFALMWWDVVHP